jgi:hypothetical protein
MVRLKPDTTYVKALSQWWDPFRSTTFGAPRITVRLIAYRTGGAFTFLNPPA